MEKIGAASEKYQSRTKTAPARGSAEAATTRQRGAYWWGYQSLRRAGEHIAKFLARV